MITALAAALGGVVLAILLWRLATARDEAPGRPRPADEEVEGLMREGRKIAAIKAYREQHPGMGLKEAKDAVERLERGQPLPPLTPLSRETPLRDQDVERLIREGQLVSAVKLFRERHPHLGLKEAKDAVDRIARFLVLALLVLPALRAGPLVARDTATPTSVPAGCHTSQS